jgi:hypothetical protein
MQEHPFMITNIVTETNNEANRIGTRIGQNIILDKTQYHALSDINNHLVDMPLSNIHTWQEKNEIAIANAHKEVWCENISKINFPYCREKLSLLKQQYANNPEALKILENTEKNLDITKTKNEVATYASTMNIDETAMHFVDKNFFTLNSQEKYRFIVNYFFENPNNPHILTLLSLYHLEKNGY